MINWQVVGHKIVWDAIRKRLIRVPVKRYRIDPSRIVGTGDSVNDAERPICIELLKGVPHSTKSNGPERYIEIACPNEVHNILRNNGERER